LLEIKILYDKKSEIGSSFEKLIYDVPKNLGYIRIRRRQKPAGMELDIEAIHKQSRKKILCECKAHQDHIGPEDLLYFHGKLRYEIDKRIVDHGMFLSTSGFTANAERWGIDAGTKTTRILSLFGPDEIVNLFEKANLLVSEKKIDDIIRNNTSLEMGKRYLVYYKSELYIIQLLLQTVVPSYLLLNANGTIPSEKVSNKIGNLDITLSKYVRLDPVITMKVIMNLADLTSKSSSKISSEMNEKRENIDVALGDLHAEKILSKVSDGSANMFKLKTDMSSFSTLVQRFDEHEQRFSFMESEYVSSVAAKEDFLQYIAKKMKIDLSDNLKKALVRAASIFPSVLSFLVLGDDLYFSNFVASLKDIRSRKEKKRLKNIVISYFLNQIYEAVLKDTRSSPGSYLRRRNILGYAFDFRINLASQDQIILGLGGALHIYIADKRVGDVFEKGQIVSPTDHSQNIVLGNHLYTLGLYTDGIETFDVVTKHSSNADYLYAAWNGKSQCYRMLNNREKEIDCINKGINLQKRSSSSKKQVTLLCNYQRKG
jgi:Restriction endonuclease